MSYPDMADWIIEQNIESMATGDWDDDRELERPRPVVCKYCGEKRLYWKEVEGKWRLTKKGKIHLCDAYSKEK